MKSLIRRFIHSLPTLVQSILTRSLDRSAKTIDRAGGFAVRSIIFEKKEDSRNIRIAFFSIVLNGSPWIRLNIESIYPFASQIFIIEGAEKRAEGYCTVDGHSIDDTLRDIDYLKSIDTEKKIIIIKNSRIWNGKTEMCNSFLHLVKADYLWQLDIDEFYKQEDIQKVKKFLGEHPETTCVQFYAKYFIGSFESISIGEFGNSPHEWNRIFKVNKYCKWLRHAPPKLVDTRTGRPMDEIDLLTRDATRGMGIYMYHYSYVTQKDIVFKEKFYHTPDLVEYLTRVKREIDTKSYPIRLVHQKFAERGDVYLVKFDGEHPLPIKNNLADLTLLELP